MAELEFEQKYILDLRRAAEIEQSLKQQSSLVVATIRQFYDKSGSRYRCAVYNGEVFATKENKRSVKIGTPYSINIEDDVLVIEAAEFNRLWEKSKRRLAKNRYIVNGVLVDHMVMVDFFLHPGAASSYAIVAEVETILHSTTQSLFLDLVLPKYLEAYMLEKVDARNTAAKIFKSANMTDTADNIEAITRALEQLYERSL